MEQKIPYYVHEGSMARMERVNHRLYTAVVIETAIVVLALIAVLKKGFR